MKKPDWETIKDVFSESFGKSGDDLDAFLRVRCSGDEDLYQELRSLLAASEQPDNLIENNSIDLASKISTTESDYSQRQFGNYRIIREIGSGGMGTVFLAERDDGEFTMQVALKIVRQSVASAEVIRRFKQERQILAGLNHPHIAVLHDGGLSDKGEPYLAMEFIDGDTLIDFANNNKLTVPERLRLFVKVCSAVAYAHRNLIVHRDIKPSNILVGADGEPKLLDFGLAKSFETEDSPILTTLRAFTPAYASPEQITGRNITTASDIYSLGVIFYELLTGAKPLALENKSFEQIVQTINANAPVPPSEIEDLRGFHLSNRQLRGDIDNIALMALRKEPERRYRSIEDFVDDIENHLSDRPVIARPNTFGYLAVKFVNRNKIAVAASILISVSLIGGISISLWQTSVARRENARSQSVNQFLRKMLMTAMPESGGRKTGEQASIIDVLGDVERSLDEDLSSEPEVRADLRHLIGEAYLSQGRYDEADKNLTKAFSEHMALFGPDNTNTLKSEISLAALYFTKADYNRAIEIYERRIGSLRDEFRRSRIEAEFYLPKLIDFATMCRARGDASRAESLLNEAIDEAKKAGDLKFAENARTLLTLILLDQGRFGEAKTYQLAAVAKLRQAVAEDDPALASLLTLLGSIQMEDADLDDADANLSEAESVYRKNYAPDYMPLYDNLRLQAQVAYLKGNYELAKKRIDLVLAAYRKNSNPKYISFATALTVEGLVENKLGNSFAAELILREAVRLRAENLPPNHFMTAMTKGSLGEVLTNLQQFPEANKLLRESLESLTKTQGPENPRTSLAATRLAALDQAAGNANLTRR